MSKEEKELLLQDLCARLPYGVIVDVNFYNKTKGLSCDLLKDFIIDEKSVRPYLRPMSSMTEEEVIEYNIAVDKDVSPERIVDWYYAHHLDFRGLIKKGLALEAPEGMYKL